MSDRQMTALERLALSVAGLVIAAAIIGVYATMQSVQQSQSEAASERAVMSTQMGRVAGEIERQRDLTRKNRDRIEALEREWGSTP